MFFLVGWEDGVFPNKRSLEEFGNKGLEEERRLAYVALTRPRKKLQITFVNQNKQLGTGHAIKQCLDEIKNFNGDILILSGDVPLIKYSTLNNFILEHKKRKSYASLITTSIKNPKGYGRIIKNESGQLVNIVEHKDANKDELKINEINSGIYIINSKALIKNIPLIKNDNAQKEYYLPDIFNFIHTENTYIYKIDDFVEISGVNTIEQLKNIENSWLK